MPNMGYLEQELTEKQLKAVWQEVIAIQEDFGSATRHQHEVVGNMEHTYLLSERTRLHLEYVLTPLTRRLHDAFPLFSRDLTLGPAWVNFQRKHEFQPLHWHAGELSFVIWLQVPYTRAEELAANPGRHANKAVSGEFEFTYTDILGGLTQKQLGVERGWEGRMLLFPARLNHQVYPFFSSDEYRISVSGNFFARTTRGKS
jgi:hypothetical protein